jgi:type III pantothenate kinase
MLLAIDVGNTQTVAGVSQGAELLHHWRVSTVRTATVDELAAQHDKILELRGGSLTGIESMVVSSVVPTLTVAYRDLARRYMDRPALVVGPGVRTGMALAIDNPHELGADRLVNAVAAFRRYGGPCLVVDFGTATNIDEVSERGEYLGGVIAPGLEISVEALTSRAARLLKVDLVAPPGAIGKSTVEALQSGIIYGTVAMVDGLVARLKGELGPSALTVATGGLAELIVPLSEQIDEHEPFLTLEGLRIIHELNVGREPEPGRGPALGARREA